VHTHRPAASHRRSVRFSTSVKPTCPICIRGADLTIYYALSPCLLRSRKGTPLPESRSEKVFSSGRNETEPQPHLRTRIDERDCVKEVCVPHVLPDPQVVHDRPDDRRHHELIHTDKHEAHLLQLPSKGREQPQVEGCVRNGRVRLEDGRQAEDDVSKKEGPVMEADGEGGKQDDQDEVVEDKEEEGAEVVEDLGKEVPARSGNQSRSSSECDF
jgi:hypothetical protein